MTTHPPLLDLYHWSTPVGAAVTIMLEESRLDYRVIPVDISKGDQFSPPFSTLSPNGKLPLLVDHNGPQERPFAIFESGAILLYLARKSGILLPASAEKLSLVEQGLFWVVSSFGPMIGQSHHFRHYAPEPVAYALTRYDGEVRRLYAVLEKRLAKQGYIAGDYSLADLALIGWVRLHERHGVDLSAMPGITRWFNDMMARETVSRGLAVGNEAIERRFNPA